MNPLLLAGLWWLAVSAGYGYFCYRMGHRRGSAFSPNDNVLRRVIQQRDRACLERDEERSRAQNAAAKALSLEAELLRLRVQRRDWRLN